MNGVNNFLWAGREAELLAKIKETLRGLGFDDGLDIWAAQLVKHINLSELS